MWEISDISFSLFCLPSSSLIYLIFIKINNYFTNKKVYAFCFYFIYKMIVTNFDRLIGRSFWVKNVNEPRFYFMISPNNLSKLITLVLNHLVCINDILPIFNTETEYLAQSILLSENNRRRKRESKKRTPRMREGPIQVGNVATPSNETDRLSYLHRHASINSHAW